MKKIVLLSIALTVAGFLSVTAQNNVPIPKQLQIQNASFEYPDYKTPKLQGIKKSNSGQDWWEPDTVSTFLYGKMIFREIFKYNSQGLAAERIRQMSLNNSWTNDALYAYTYDSNYNMLTESIYGWNGNSWITYYQYIYAYNANNNLLSILTQIGENNSWVNDQQYTYNYDANNNLLTVLYQYWESNSLVNVSLDTYTYDFNNNLLSELHQRESNNSWENYDQNTYTYDANNNLLTNLWQDWINNSWVNDCLYAYTYDSNNNMLTEKSCSYSYTYTYDSNNNVLTKLIGNSSLFVYSYDSNNNMLTELQQNWQNNSWVNISQTSYTYDSNNNKLTELRQNWGNNTWVNSIQYLMTYDENMNGISAERWTWVDEKWQPLGNSSEPIYLFYNNMQSALWRMVCEKLTSSFIKVSDLTAIKEPQATPELNAISIYPNPTMGKLRITNSKLRIKDIQIFNVTGNKFPLSVEKAGDEIDISHLPAGTYFVQVTTEKGIVTKKVVKL